MGFLDILKQYADPTGNAASTSQAHFDEVASSAPPDLLGRGVSEALRSDQTPPFADMVSQMFGRSNPQQQAGLLNQMLGSLGSGVLPGLAGGMLGHLFGGGGAAASGPGPALTPAQASQLTPDQVREIAAHAEKQDPGIVDKVGDFYGQHPDLVKGLGAMALAVVLGKMSGHAGR